ncbi:hypothetical protein D3C73_1185280 [compost metagenome]
MAAVGPLMPTSTSSKISAGVSILRAVITWIASAMRDSSPPEATFASACSGWPGLVETQNSVRVAPSALKYCGSKRTSILNLPCGMESACMLSVINVVSSAA